jgi:hypothetical protein
MESSYSQQQQSAECRVLDPFAQFAKEPALSLPKGWESKNLNSGQLPISRNPLIQNLDHSAWSAISGLESHHVLFSPFGGLQLVESGKASRLPARPEADEHIRT